MTVVVTLGFRLHYGHCMSSSRCPSNLQKLSKNLNFSSTLHSEVECYAITIVSRTITALDTRGLCSSEYRNACFSTLSGCLEMDIFVSRSRGYISFQQSTKRGQDFSFEKAEFRRLEFVYTD